VNRLLRFMPTKTTREADRAIRFVVRSAYLHIPGYRRLLDEKGIRPERIHGASDLPQLPVLHRAMLFWDEPLPARLHVRANPSRCVRVHTSGSEGIPLDVYMSRGEALYRRTSVFLSWRREVRLRFPLTVADIGTWVEPGAASRTQRRGPVTVTRISILEPVERQIELLAQIRPQVISGYPTALEILAEHVRKLDARLPVRLVATRGEILHTATRRSLEDAFGSRVADFYNCEEVGNIAWECPKDQQVLHVNTAACAVEIVDAAGNPLPADEEGRVLITNLYNCTMPFIRYDLQDRGVLLESARRVCSCGSRNPRMAVVQGRDDDFIRLPDGRRVSPRLVATGVEKAFAKLETREGGEAFFRRFQVIQDALDHLTIRVVPIPGRVVPLAEHIAPALRRLHPDLRCTIELVDDLPPALSGKFRKVTRAIESPEDRMDQRPVRE